MVRLFLFLLGQFEVRLDGHSVTGFQSDKARSLLAYLAVESDRPHRREFLSSLFWPDVSDSTARTNLRSALANIRQVIGDSSSHPPFIIVTRESLQFNPQSAYWLDIAEFNRMLAEREDKYANLDRAELTHKKIEGYKSAISIYRGSFLEGLSPKNCSGFDDWSYNLQERLQYQASTTLCQIAEYYERCGEVESAIEYSQRWVNLVPWKEEAQYYLMRLLAVKGERAAAMSQFKICRRMLADHLGVEPSGETVRLYEIILDGKTDEIKQTVGELLPAPGKSPFKGLQFFNIDDSGLFFGREALTARLGQELRETVSFSTKGSGGAGHRFLAVVGASGSGKSSVVRAGLASALKGGVLSMEGETENDKTGHWPIFIITPGVHPIANLEGVAENGNEPRILVVDQFEELFTLCNNDSERDAFIDQLLNRKEFVVIALRADFFANCAQYPALRQALDTHQEYLGAMSASELRRAITEPAKRYGWEFEQGLIDLILRDVNADPDHGPEPGALPLLSHALFETWKKRSGHMLTLRGYEEAGAIHGVIAKLAEMVFASLDHDRQAITKRIFLRMTELGEGIQDIRRRVSLDELVPGGSSREVVLEVLRRLADARLVVTDWNPATKQVEVEMAHEALIHHWPRLRGWLEEDRTSLRLSERIRDAAQEWQASGRINHLLVHRDERLGASLTLLQSGRLAFSQLEMDYLIACQNRGEHESKGRERRRNGLILTALVVSVGLAIIALWGLLQADKFQRQAEISLAQQLAAQAADLLEQPSMNEIAVLLSIESINHFPYRAANEILAHSLSLFPKMTAIMKQDGRVSTAVFSPDGKWIASGGWNKAIRVWDVKNGREVAYMTHDGQVWSVIFSPDGKQVASASNDGTARVWEIESGREMARMVNNGAVWSIAYSPDGNWIATGSQDGTARVWDIQSGRELSRMQHNGIVYSVSFSPDGKKVISGSQDGTARIWDAESGRELARLTNESEIWTIAFSSNGQQVVSGGWDGIVRVWDAATGRELTRMQHNDDVRSVAFNPDGMWVVSGSDDGTLRVWDAESGRELSRMQHTGRVLSVNFSPDGKAVISCSEDGTARVWDALSGRELARMQHDELVSSAAFSPDGKQVVSASWDGTVRVWKLETGRELIHMQLTGGISSVAFDPDGAKVMASSEDGTVRLWDVASGDQLMLMQHAEPVTSALFSKDGKKVISGTSFGKARVWDAVSGLELSRLEDDKAVNSMAFSPDGKWAISGSEDGTARVWQTENGREAARINLSQPVRAVAFSPDGREVISGGQDGTVQVWVALTGQEVVQLKHDGLVIALAFSPDGSKIISGSEDGTARVWITQTGQEVARVNHLGPVSSVAFSPDGKEAISGSEDGTARVWVAETGREVAQLKFGGAVTCVAFSPNGKVAIAGSQDGTVRVWDVKTGREISRYLHDKAITSVAFSPDGKQVVSGSEDGAIRVWLWQDEDLIEMACSRLTRNLTPSEWEQYMGDRPYHQSCPNLPPG